MIALDADLTVIRRRQFAAQYRDTVRWMCVEMMRLVGCYRYSPVKLAEVALETRHEADLLDPDQWRVAS